MKYVLLTYCIFFSSLVFAQSRIIGGAKTEIDDAPWTANMRIVNTYGVRLLNRSAVVISENLVLTAYHNWPTYDYSYLLVHVGGSCLDIGKYNKVHRFIKHPTLDLVLLELSTPIEFSEKIQPIDYKSPTVETLYKPGKSGFISGWGATVPDDPSSTPMCLESVDVTFVERSVANGILGYTAADENTITTLHKDPLKMAGRGDSGGPIAVWDNQQGKYILAGIAKMADVRAASSNSGITVYTKVNLAIDWINANKCELTGPSVIPSEGATFEIENLPPGTTSVEWKLSGLIKVTSTNAYIDVVPENIDAVTKGSISAVITTSEGTLTLPVKQLDIQPRADISASIVYANNKYQLKVKAINMGELTQEDIVKCKNISDYDQLFGFVWSYNGEIAIGSEAFFNITPNTSKTYTVTLVKYDCESTTKLEKTFTLEKKNNEYVPVSNTKGNITLGGNDMFVMSDLSVGKNINMLFSKSTPVAEFQASLYTSPINIESVKWASEDSFIYNITIYSRSGSLMYSGKFDSENKTHQINTSTFPSGIYILNIQNITFQTTKSHNIIIGN